MPWSPPRLFNPSIVPHPDQTDLPEGALRFVMSLRATGEGHISSIEFRSGMIAADGCITMDHDLAFRHRARDPAQSELPQEELRHQAPRNVRGQAPYCAAVMDPLGDCFTLSELKKFDRRRARARSSPNTAELTRTLERIQWLADSNYELRFPPDLA